MHTIIAALALLVPAVALPRTGKRWEGPMPLDRKQPGSIAALWDGIDLDSNDILTSEPFEIVGPEEYVPQNQRRMWDGYDPAPLTSAARWQIRTSGSLQNVRLPTGVEVMGLQDTGTNLLSTLFYTNCRNRVSQYDSTFGPMFRGVWKHANMARLSQSHPEGFANLVENHVVPLVMLRSPLSWLQSIRKAPYELAPCVTGSDWLLRPCRHTVPGGYDALGDVPAETFPNLVDVWGQWTSGYRALYNVFPKVILLRYEHVVKNTKAIVRYIGEALNITMPRNIDTVQDPAKKHGDSLGRAEAVGKIDNKEYLDLYSETELSTACEHLLKWKWLLEKYEYDDDCASHWAKRSVTSASQVR